MRLAGFVQHHTLPPQPCPSCTHTRCTLALRTPPPQIKRTEGVSTTDIVGRMLTCTRVNPFISDEDHPLVRDFSIGDEADSDEEEGDDKQRERTTLSKFMPTSRRLVQFSNGRVPAENARIVYIDGAFDVFHPGHVRTLAAAKAHGDFLLVGVHTDEDVQERRGPVGGWLGGRGGGAAVCWVLWPKWFLWPCSGVGKGVEGRGERFGLRKPVPVSDCRRGSAPHQQVKWEGYASW